MFDYAAWVRRAKDRFEGYRTLSSDIRVTNYIGPCITRDELSGKIEDLRLPIPECLIRFWTDGTREFACEYDWTTPPECRLLMRVAFPHWNMSHVWGGTRTVTPSQMSSIDSDFESVMEGALRDYPLDQEFFKCTVPFFFTSTGDMVGLYIRDQLQNPPIAWISHEGGNCSDIICPSFEQFLMQWERCHYLALDFLSFHTSQNVLDIDASPDRRDAIDSLFRCNAPPKKRRKGR